MNCHIVSVGFTDHDTILMELVPTVTGTQKSFWHFNTELLLDFTFVKIFWRSKKHDFQSLIGWWQVVEVQIRNFCQQYTYKSTDNIRRVIRQLEQEITDLESVSVSQNNQQDLLYHKRMKLLFFRRELTRL